jgi:hypothetical protein
LSEFASRFNGQGQPHPAVLAHLRPRPRPLLRPPRTGSRDSRPGHGGGVLARGHCFRFLARRRTAHPVPGVLLLHRTRARRPYRPYTRAQSCGVAGHRVGPPSRTALRRYADRTKPAPVSARLLRECLPSRSKQRGMGHRRLRHSISPSDPALSHSRRYASSQPVIQRPSCSSSTGRGRSRRCSCAIWLHLHLSAPLPCVSSPGVRLTG